MYTFQTPIVLLSLLLLLLPALSLAQEAPPTQESHSSSTSISVTPSTQPSGKPSVKLSATEDGKQITIIQSDAGITVTYPNSEGESVSVSAKDPKDLKDQSPGAYDIYKKYAPQLSAAASGRSVRFSQRITSRPPADAPNGPDAPLNLPPPPAIEDMHAQMEALRARLQDPMNPHTGATAELDPEKLGVLAEPTSGPLQAQLGKGILVKGVLLSSLAQKLGLQQYDIITSINNTPISTLQDLRNSLSAGEVTSLQIFRQAKPLTLPPSPPQAPTPH